VDVFWEAFNPDRLFFTGESSLQISTREVGSLLTPVAVFLVVGLVVLIRSGRRDGAWLFVFGLLTAPLAAVLMADVEIRRWLVLMPFAAIVAGFGIDRVLAVRYGRATVAALLVLMAVQFGMFTRDYFGPYRERSSDWFGGNIRAAIESVLADARVQPPSTVYIASDLPWVDAHWQFYGQVHGQDLRDRTRYVRLASGEIPKAVDRAVLICPADSSLAATMEGSGWVQRRVVPDIDGTPSIIVFAAPSP
jgi:hypothetical protein